MSPLVVYVLAIMAVSATAQRYLDCYDTRGNLRYALGSFDPRNCKPWCPPGCPQGRCMRDNECDCGRGYRDARTAAQKGAKANVRCVPVCRNACYQGDCVAPDTCKCWPGHMRMPYAAHVCD